MNKIIAIAIDEYADPTIDNLKNCSKDINSLIGIKGGKNWEDIFPAIRKLNINPEGKGFIISLRIAKKEGNPVYIVPDGTPGATPLAIKKVNDFDFFSLNLEKLS